LVIRPTCSRSRVTTYSVPPVRVSDVRCRRGAARRVITTQRRSLLSIVLSPIHWPAQRGPITATPSTLCLAAKSRQGRRQVKKCGLDWDTHGEHAEREPIPGSGDGVPIEVRGQTPRQLVMGLENLLAFGTQWKQQICFILRDHDRPPSPE